MDTNEIYAYVKRERERLFHLLLKKKERKPEINLLFLATMVLCNKCHTVIFIVNCFPGEYLIVLR